MKRLNAQRTLWKVFSSGREALGLLQEMEEGCGSHTGH
jgi:hypothetical protein